MGYDVGFWKQSGKLALSPSEISNTLSEGVIPSGIEPLPLTDIFNDLKVVYPGIYREKGFEGKSSDSWAWNNTYSSYPSDFPEIIEEYGELPAPNFPGENGGFICYVSPYRLFFNCHFDDMTTLNPMIDLMAKYGCLLYDCQDDKRWDGS